MQKMTDLVDTVNLLLAPFGTERCPWADPFSQGLYFGVTFPHLLQPPFPLKHLDGVPHTFISGVDSTVFWGVEDMISG